MFRGLAPEEGGGQVKLESKTFALQTEGRVEKGQVGVKRGCWAGTRGVAGVRGFWRSPWGTRSVCMHAS